MRPPKLALILFALGIALFVAGLAAGVVAGGVPYPDGPNAGHTSPPGPRRILEHVWFPIVLVGAFLTLTGTIGLGVALVRVRRSGGSGGRSAGPR